MISLYSYGQSFTIPDSLQHKTIDELEKLVFDTNDSIGEMIYSRSLLAKAKQEKDSLGLARGYRLVSFNYGNNLARRIVYLDSSIQIGKKIKRDDYPEYSYSNLAWVYYKMNNYNKSIDNFLSALEYSKASNNRRFYFMTKQNIAFIKTKIDEYDEAIQIYKEVMHFDEQNKTLMKTRLTTILRLANAYRKVNLLDSATIYNTKGFELADKNGLHTFSNNFVLNEGINMYYKQKHQASLDSMLKSISLISRDNIVGKEISISGYLHISKLYKVLGEHKKSFEYLQKLDNYYNETNLASTEMREGYELLVNYYKSIDNKNKQLEFINKLFKIDSILDNSYKDISKKVVHEYDTPKLLAEKQQLIDALSIKEKQTSTKFIFVLILAVVLIIVFALTYCKNLRYKKRFVELMNTQVVRTSMDDHIINKNAANPETIGISEDIVATILEGLTKFEANEGFLLASLTTATLAKQLHTNTKYLSKVINTYKQKSFSVYINELRVDYAIQKLKTDAKFRQYTIKAIAQESGFNTTEAFSKSFYKKTGIYPSYFIKQLEKESIV